MTILNDIGILVMGIRGLMYLEAFIRNDTLPGVAIIQGSDSLAFRDKYPISFWSKYRSFFDADKDLNYYLEQTPLKSIVLEDPSIHSPELKDILSRRPEKYFIFSGGGIIKQELLSVGKSFIHLHPGLLPQYRGSTCFYYSFLGQGSCGASAFFMQSEIDRGDIIAQKMFVVPSVPEEDWYFYDLLFDPWMRAELLGDVIRQYKKTKSFSSLPQEKNRGEDYFIIHPVLKNLAIGKMIKQKNTCGNQIGGRGELLEG